MSKIDKIEKVKHSLSKKVVIVIGVASILITLAALIVSYSAYTATMNKHYESLCRGIVGIMKEYIDADNINRYLAGLDKEEYAQTDKQLATLLENIPEIKFIYVYQISEDGVHVVFDIDAPDFPAAELGDIIPIEEDYIPLKADLLVGNPIPTLITRGVYGWLMSVYEPVLDSNGVCVAYACADISMSYIMSDRTAFIATIAAFLFGMGAVITSLLLWYVQTRVVKPVNSLSAITHKFAFDEKGEATDVPKLIAELNIHTSDEIENLCTSVKEMISNAAVYIDELKEQKEDIAKKAGQIQAMQEKTILSFANMIENRDKNTGGHVRRTAAYVRVIASELINYPDSELRITKGECENICRSAPLHDIGKIVIEDSILNKPGKLTAEEFEQIKLHVAAGGKILTDTFTGIEGDNYLCVARDMARYHHERWDAGGYVDGLCGEEIPLSARIMAIADVFDALISKRSYKERMSLDEAFAEIQRGAGTHFDPRLCNVFLSKREEIELVTRQLEESPETE